MDEQQTYERIELYLAGELKGEGLQEFEQRLANDAEFPAEVELHRGLEVALGDEVAMQFAGTLAEADAEYFGESQSDEAETPVRAMRPFWQQSYSIAAAVLVLVMIGVFFFLRNEGKPSPDDLYASYFSVYDANATWRAGDPVIDAELKAAFDAYNAKNFDAAGKAFARLEAEDSTNVTARFYLAMCAMAGNQHDRAMPRLEQLIAATGHPFRTQARWYLALVHLHAGDVEAAKPLLETLAGGAGKYKTLAVEVLGKF